jgi:hypothetical protein
MIGGSRPAPDAQTLLKTDYPYAAAAFDDKRWELVDAPHDFIARNAEFTLDADSHRGYLPRGVGWYRKHFAVPWAKGDTVQLHFEGVFHHAMVYLNGELLQVQPWAVESLNSHLHRHDVPNHSML